MTDKEKIMAYMISNPDWFDAKTIATALGLKTRSVSTYLGWMRGDGTVISKTDGTIYKWKIRQNYDESCHVNVCSC